MSLLTNTNPPDVAQIGKVFVKLDLPADMDAEYAAGITTAILDLFKLGLRITQADGNAPKIPVHVRSIQYGSPYEELILIAGTVGFVAGVAYTCTKVMNGLADFRIKLAQARRIIAETNSIQSPAGSKWDTRDFFDGRSWRFHKVTEPDLLIEPKRKAEVPGEPELYVVESADGLSRVEFTARELDAVYVIQAEKITGRIISDLAHRDTTDFRGGDLNLTRREIKSLVILSEFGIEIRVLDEWEDPHAQ